MVEGKKEPLPSSLSAIVDSFNELLPGIPWDDSTADAILYGISELDYGGLSLPVDVPFGKVEVALVADSRGQDGSTSVKGCIIWSLPNDVVWDGNRPATKEGLLDLLQEIRRVIRRLRHGPCATCVAQDPPAYHLRLSPEGGCVVCTLKSFLQA